jgi:putative protease
MKPDGRNIAAKVLAMYTPNKATGLLEPVESCPHSKQILYVELSEKAGQYDLMRVEKL